MGVKCSPGAVPFWVDGELLKDKIKEKASKYRTLTQSMQVPLVVGVVPDFRTGRGMNEVREAALGTIQRELRKRVDTTVQSSLTRLPGTASSDQPPSW